MAGIHPSAIVDPKAELDPSVEVGAYALIGPNVCIGAGSVIHPFAQVVGHTEMGQNNVVHAHCVIGGPPQDKKYKGEPTKVRIGASNTFRECCTVNSGTVQDIGVTCIGDHNWIMAYVHIAHDCTVGSHIIMANATQIGGHVQVGDWAVLGGITAVHQFVKIGAHAMTAAGTTLTQDLPPYVMASGNPAAAHGINSEGLKRRGFSEGQIACIKRAYRLLYKSGMSLEKTIDELQEPARIGAADESERVSLAVLVNFLGTVSRGIVR